MGFLIFVFVFDCVCVFLNHSPPQFNTKFVILSSFVSQLALGIPCLPLGMLEPQVSFYTCLTFTWVREI